MQEKGLEFHYYPMDSQERVLEYLKKEHGHKTVPIITENINGDEVLIGGYDDLVKHIRQQEDKESN
jgi:glutaredoxin|tara:strand:- start:4 stop:201 length:198 start_codon:yes stop_codon:yes gene_type:complete